jgi:hypothetical protein
MQSVKTPHSPDKFRRVIPTNLERKAGGMSSGRWMKRVCPSNTQQQRLWASDPTSVGHFPIQHSARHIAQALGSSVLRLLQSWDPRCGRMCMGCLITDPMFLWLPSVRLTRVQARLVAGDPAGSTDVAPLLLSTRPRGGNGYFVIQGGKRSGRYRIKMLMARVC